MSALDELLKDIPQDYDEVDVANHLLHWREQSATELLDLRAELATSKARAKTAEENWHKNEAQLGRDGLIFMECMKLLGLDVSGTDPEAIPAAIKRLKGVA